MHAVALALALAAAVHTLAVRATSGDWKRLAPHPDTAERAWSRDHGAHPDYRTEWWYATGELAGADGARFGVQLTVFRQGVTPGPAAEGESPLRARHVFAGHLVVIDIASGRLVRAERLRRDTPGLAAASAEGLDVVLEGWSMRMEGDAILLRADDRERGLALDLALRPTKPLVLHGADGLSRKGAEPGNASVYASWTRLETRGTLTLAGREHRVQGASWFDHEWGTTQLGADVVGWDWFGLRLDDGRELMLYRLRRKDGSAHPASAATLVAKDGTPTHLPLARFTYDASATWKSSASGAVYPARWRLRLAEEHLDLELVPRVADCEVDGRASTGVIYWEGPVEVRGSATGSGHAELTGYAGSLAGRF